MKKSELYNMVANTGSLDQIKLLIKKGETPDNVDENNKKLIEHIFEANNKKLFYELENILWNQTLDKVYFGSKEIDSKTYAKLIKLNSEKFLFCIFNLTVEEINDSVDELSARTLIATAIEGTEFKEFVVEKINEHPKKAKALLKLVRFESLQYIIRNKDKENVSFIYKLLNKETINKALNAGTMKDFTNSPSMIVIKLEESNYDDFYSLPLEDQLKTLKIVKENQEYRNPFHTHFNNNRIFDKTEQNNIIQRFINAILSANKVELVKPLLDIFEDDFKIEVYAKLSDKILEELIKHEDEKHIIFNDFDRYLNVKSKNKDSKLAPLYKKVYRLEAQNKELKRALSLYVSKWNEEQWDDDD